MRLPESGFQADIVVAGAGFAGSVAARELAEHGFKVLICEQRPHIGGNAYDYYDAHGVLVHAYGPHIFHTNSLRILRWLSRFTDWRFYEHRVLAQVAGGFYPVPINQSTINQLYGLNLDEEGIEAFLAQVRLPRETLRTSEDVVLSSVGHDLCEKFFRGYTQKQWGRDLSELSAGVAARIPTRANDDDRYFTDTYQFMPQQGYTALFERMLSHDNIRVRLNTDFRAFRQPETPLVYTGPIDGFFDNRLGALPYRSLRFEHWHEPIARKQPVGTLNFPNDYAYTRTTEFKHLTGQIHAGTSLVAEYPQDAGEPYYPIPTADNEALFQQYQALANQAQHVYFVGRLAQYRYYNMDQVVGAALKTAQDIIGARRQAQETT